jgi:hypothetical protein
MINQISQTPSKIIPGTLNQHSSVFSSSAGAFQINDSPSNILQRNNFEDIQMGEYSGGVAASDITN